jgi:hypothetical protein
MEWTELPSWASAISAVASIVFAFLAARSSTQAAESRKAAAAAQISAAESQERSAQTQNRIAEILANLERQSAQDRAAPPWTLEALSLTGYHLINNSPHTITDVTLQAGTPIVPPWDLDAWSGITNHPIHFSQIPGRAAVPFTANPWRGSRTVTITWTDPDGNPQPPWQTQLPAVPGLASKHSKLR